MQCPMCQMPLDDELAVCSVCAGAAGASDSSELDANSTRALVQRALGTQYQLLSVLGRGGMGVVYLARQSGLERLVAVKVLASTNASQEGRERFRREARMAAALTHPNILPVFAFGEAGEVPYIVMGYVRSETLADRLRHEGRVPLDRTRQILAELASALDYAHRHGVVHRDIKPENILLEDESGRAVLMDFGIARSHAAGGTLTATGMAVGTPMYMSPEQQLGTGGIDGRSDIYSLGLVAYEMLAGQAPFAEPNEKFRQRGPYAAAPLHDIVPEVPEDLAMAIMRCLAREPDDRWPDARSFAHAVARGNAEAGVPDELREVAGFGSWSLLWILVWAVVAAREYLNGRSSILLTFVALLVPVGFGLQGWHIHRSGFSARQILYVGFWPPKFWSLWWPRRLRRPDDLWGMLPLSSRVGRVMLTIFFIATPILAYIESGAAPGGATPLATRMLKYVSYILVTVTTIGIVTLAARWRRLGMGTKEMAGLIIGSSVSGTFWRQPQISPFLLNANKGQAAGPTTPHELLRAIADTAESLAGATRASGSNAVAAARVLLPAIEMLDNELESLRRNADPAEVVRVEVRLALMEEAGARAGGGGDEDHEQMRVLLRRQLELFARLQARREAVMHQQKQLVERLRSLWVALCKLRQDDPKLTSNASQSASHVESLRALCLAIERDGLTIGPMSVPTLRGDSHSALTE